MATAASKLAGRLNMPPRRYPVGAELVPGGVHFRVWAPDKTRLSVVVENGREYDLDPEPGGYFSATVVDAAPGTLYRFRIDGDGPYPDPASRFQPDGPHGPSMVIDPTAYRWRDEGWRGVSIHGQVLYEMHVGTFTPKGTWAAAEQHLPDLAATGITVVEVMPVADFPGRFGWGYDGVDMFAPTRLYGIPDDFRHFVDRAHGLGLGVILDVVYNHFGPDGNYLRCYADAYFSHKYENEWGDPINFDGPDAGPVRAFFVANAAYWIDEYHLDGLRLDATQQIFDASPTNVLVEITRAVHRAAGARQTIIISENEPQQVRMVRPLAEDGFGHDAIWNDDFHHAAMVAMSGRAEAYYIDYSGSPQELISAAKYGFLYQGQWYAWQQQTRGTPCFGIAPEHFVSFIQNHDQIANSGRGQRIQFLTSPGRLRAVTALMLLMPSTPMLFQGQEFAASAPFLYFADHPPELAKAVAAGRSEFLSQFPTLATPELASCMADPADPATFRTCKLDHSERQRHGEAVALHRDLLTLRKRDPVLSAQRPVDGAVLGPEAFVLRLFAADGADRLILVNLGSDLPMTPAPEPLLAPPLDMSWRLLWSSEQPCYGGCGTPQPEPGRPWRLMGHATIVLAAEEVA